VLVVAFVVTTVLQRYVAVFVFLLHLQEVLPVVPSSTSAIGVVTDFAIALVVIYIHIHYAEMYLNQVEEENVNLVTKVVDVKVVGVVQLNLVYVLLRDCPYVVHVVYQKSKHGSILYIFIGHGLLMRTSCPPGWNIEPTWNLRFTHS